MTSGNSRQFGPENPHPLSTLKTELVWDGKYDEYGNRREVDVAGCAMPLQKIETIDEPRSRTEAQGEVFDTKTSHRDDFRNMLIWGDNKLVMASLLRDFKGKIDLIYIDPPFDVGADFSMDIEIGGETSTRNRTSSNKSQPKTYVTRNHALRYYSPSTPRKIPERTGNFPRHRSARVPRTWLGHLGYPCRLA